MRDERGSKRSGGWCCHWLPYSPQRERSVELLPAKEPRLWQERASEEDGGGGFPPIDHPCDSLVPGWGWGRGGGWRVRRWLYVTRTRMAVLRAGWLHVTRTLRLELQIKRAGRSESDLYTFPDWILGLRGCCTGWFLRGCEGGRPPRRLALKPARATPRK
jgi:hypothetical protein